MRSALTRQVSEGPKDLDGPRVPRLTPQAHRIAALRADRVGPRGDQVSHDFLGHLGVELDCRDRLRKAERLRRASLVGGEELRASRHLIDHVEMGLLHRDLALRRPGEERVLAAFRRELYAHGPDLAALRIAHDFRPAGPAEQLVPEADAENGNACGAKAQEAIAELVHPGLGCGERERRAGDDDPLRLRGQITEALALVRADAPELRADGPFEPIGIVAVLRDHIPRRRAGLDDEQLRQQSSSGHRKLLRYANITLGGLPRELCRRASAYYLIGGWAPPAPRTPAACAGAARDPAPAFGAQYGENSWRRQPSPELRRSNRSARSSRGSESARRRSADSISTGSCAASTSPSTSSSPSPKAGSDSAT